MEKLLFLGVSTDTHDALAYAKSKGIYTIITDYNSVEKSVEKRNSDEYWCIDLKHLDVIEQKCREEHINGIYAGNSEFCLDKVKELTKRLGLPFYASEEGWEAARNKLLFKQSCIAVGLAVPRRYSFGKSPDPHSKILEKITYPVFVKPADSSASQGVSICKTAEELRTGYQNALSYSESGNVIIEDYINGREMAAYYFVQNGNAKLIYINEVIPTVVNGKRYYFGVAVNNHDEYENYDRKTSAKVKKLFSRLNCEDGCIFLQMIKKNEQYYFIEMGYRLDGIGGWIQAKEIYGIDTIAQMVDLSLGKKHSIQKYETDCSNQKAGLLYLLGAKKGKIADIRGLEKVKNMDGVKVVLERCHANELQSNEGNMYQAVYYISILGTNIIEAIKKLHQVNENLCMYDENASDILIRFTDYNRLLKSADSTAEK